MNELTLGPWKVGIDLLSPETGLPEGAVADAVNVDFDRAGSFDSRPGFAALATEPGLHSLWRAKSGSAYCVRGGAICSITCDGSSITTTPLWTLALDLPVCFTDLNDGVVASHRGDVLHLAPDGTARRLGVENPGGLQVVPETFGGLYAGRYAVAVSFLRGGEESGLSYGAFATVVNGGGLRLTVPQPLEGEVDTIRLYRTQANGERYYRVTDLPIGLTSYLLGATDLGRQADNQFLERMPGGQIVRYWRGRLLIARGSVLMHSPGLRYGLYDPRSDFTQFPKRITLLEPVEQGVFVGGAFGIRFLSGEKPGTWNQKTTGAKPPIEGTGTVVDAAELSGDLGKSGEYVALWLAQNGFVIGTAQGSVVEVQGARIRLPAAQASEAGATMVRNRRVIAVVN